MKTNILHILRSLHNDESGQDLIEYALIASMIALGAVTAMTGLSTKISTAFSSVGTRLGAQTP
jgi:pilus assembly protein Flp/PilA